MARFYYLGPWIAPDAEIDSWHAPEGTVGLIDLRPVVPSTTHGFFATDVPLNNSDYEPFGDAQGTRLEGLTMSPQQRSKWASMLGIADTIQPGTLLDVLWDTLTIHSDPDGVSHAKPIMPTSQGVLELHLGGHSLVKSARMPKNPLDTPHWAKMQRVLQNDYLEAEATADKGKTQKERDHNRKWLGFMARKYGLTYQAATDLLIPSGRPKVAPMKPETSISDDFNRANADPISNAAAGWSWTEVSGTSWTVLSNTCRFVSQSSTIRTARAETDLSGADHYAQLVVTAMPYDDAETRQGPCTRFSSSAETCYAGALALAAAGSKNVFLYSISAGTATQIGNAAYSWSNGDTVKQESNGSTITLYVNGASQSSVTDTAISAGTRTGMYVRYVFNANMDDFAAEDLGAATGQPTRKRWGGVPHSAVTGRGVW